MTAGVAAAAGLEQGTDYTKVIQDFDMSLLLSRQVDVAEAMIYNEYAQVLEATNPATGELYQAPDLNVINWNDEGSAMLQDGLYARADWLARPGNEAVATRFLKASFEGWIYCRDNPADCVQYTINAGSTLGPGHQAWMLNEVNPLIWPSPDGIGVMDPERVAAHGRRVDGRGHHQCGADHRCVPHGSRQGSAPRPRGRRHDGRVLREGHGRHHARRRLTEGRRATMPA